MLTWPNIKIPQTIVVLSRSNKGDSGEKSPSKDMEKNLFQLSNLS